MVHVWCVMTTFLNLSICHRSLALLYENGSSNLCGKSFSFFLASALHSTFYFLWSLIFSSRSGFFWLYRKTLLIFFVYLFFLSFLFLPFVLFIPSRYPVSTFLIHQPYTPALGALLLASDRTVFFTVCLHLVRI